MPDRANRRRPTALRPVTALLSLLPVATAFSADWPPSWHFAEGWRLATSASVQYQALHAGPLDDDGFRRQRVAATLVSPQGIAFKVDYDFAAGTWADVALQVPFTGAQRLRIGQVKAPLGLETFGSHRDVALLERASLSTLLPGRRVGVKWSAARGASHYTVFAAGDSLDRQERGAGLYARATRAFGASTEWVSCTWVSAADVTGVVDHFVCAVGPMFRACRWWAPTAVRSTSRIASTGLHWKRPGIAGPGPCRRNTRACVHIVSAAQPPPARCPISMGQAPT